MRANTYQEEPECKAPEPESEKVCADHADLACEFAVSFSHEVTRDDSRKFLTHCDNSCYGETRGTNADKHTGAKRLLRELLRHEAVDEGSIDHERNKESNSLDNVTSQDDREGCGWILDLGG